MGQGYEPWTPPPAPGSPPGQRGVLAVLAIAGSLLIALVALGVALVWNAHGSHATAARPGTVTTTSTTGAQHPGATIQHQPVSDIALAVLGVQPGDLGVNWVDDGTQTYSSDLARPPSDCAPYARVFNSREAGAVHQYSFNPQGNYEEGGLSSTVIENSSQAAVAAELPAVRSNGFVACAEATAVEWLNNHEDRVTVLDLHAAPINLVSAANVAGWRAMVDYTGTAGHATFAMDIFYTSASNYLAKIRVALCPCKPQPGASLALLPDEVQTVTTVKDRLTTAASQSDPSAVTEPGTTPSVVLSDPCQLLTPAQVGAVIGAAKPPARITTGDEANECTWLSAAGKSVVIQSGDSIVQFQTRLRDTPQPFAGLGDQAAVDPEFAGKVLVRKGNVWIEVFVEGTTSDRGNAVDLARALLPKL